MRGCRNFVAKTPCRLGPNIISIARFNPNSFLSTVFTRCWVLEVIAVVCCFSQLSQTQQQESLVSKKKFFWQQAWPCKWWFLTEFDISCSYHAADRDTDHEFCIEKHRGYRLNGRFTSPLLISPFSRILPYMYCRYLILVILNVIWRLLSSKTFASSLPPCNFWGL